MSDTVIVIKEGTPVALPQQATGRVTHLYGKGTRYDPCCAVVEIPAQTITVRVSKLHSLEKTHG